MVKDNCKMLIWLIALMGGGWVITGMTSCGKAGTVSAAGLNIEYEVLNLSPDLLPVNLYINYISVNTTPYTFNEPQGYFYLTSNVQPFQFRTAVTPDTTLFSRSDTLKTGAKYTLYITGQRANNTISQTFTVDTATTPTLGHGKVRFVNVAQGSPGGLDIYANGTVAFSKIVYPAYSAYRELPVGNYDFQITATGTTGILKDMPAVTVQDGKLYTIYAFGYTTRADSAAFNAGIITNK